MNDIQNYARLKLNRRIPNGMYGGVRGRRLGASSYSILCNYRARLPFSFIMTNHFDRFNQSVGSIPAMAVSKRFIRLSSLIQLRNLVTPHRYFQRLEDDRPKFIDS
jgi:hypothetical protein